MPDDEIPVSRRRTFRLRRDEADDGEVTPRLSVGGMDSHCGADRTISETPPGRSDVAGYPVDGWKQFRHF